MPPRPFGLLETVLGLWGENDALCRVGRVGPGLFDFGEWRGPRVDVEGPVGNLLDERGKFGEDFAGADGALSTADDLEASGGPATITSMTCRRHQPRRGRETPRSGERCRTRKQQRLS